MRMPKIEPEIYRPLRDEPHSIVKLLTAEMGRLKKDRVAGAEQAWKLIHDAKFFDLQACRNEVANLAAIFRDQGAVPREAKFLPSSKTFVQADIKGNQDIRAIGLLLSENRSRAQIVIESVVYNGSRFIVTGPTFLTESDELINPPYGWPIQDHGLFSSGVAAMLTMINKTRVFGSKQTSPHAALINNLRRQGNLPGHFPLQAWTEIVLPIGDAKPAGKASESRGHRETAYHWVRAHLGHRWGKRVVIKECWRGNPALGIRRSRYNVGGRAALPQSTTLGQMP